MAICMYKDVYKCYVFVYWFGVVFVSVLAVFHFIVITTNKLPKGGKNA